MQYNQCCAANGVQDSSSSQETGLWACRDKSYEQLNSRLAPWISSLCEQGTGKLGAQAAPELG
jgi:hypothetical protein